MLMVVDDGAFRRRLFARAAASAGRHAVRARARALWHVMAVVEIRARAAMVVVFVGAHFCPQARSINSGEPRRPFFGPRRAASRS